MSITNTRLCSSKRQSSRWSEVNMASKTWANLPQRQRRWIVLLGGVTVAFSAYAYCPPQYVNAAVAQLVPFFRRTLA